MCGPCRHIAHAISDIAWSPDGRTLVSSSRDGMIILWNAETDGRLHTLKGSKGGFVRLVFDPAGRMLASGGGEKAVRLWEVASGTIVRTLKGDSKEVTGVSWSKDGSWLASSSMDGTVRIWDTLSWSQFKVISTGDKEVKLAVAWASDSRRVAAASFQAWICEAATGAPIHEFSSGGLYYVAWSPDRHSRLLATASSDNTVGIWRTATGSTALSLEGHTGHLRFVDFSADGRLLASSAADGTIRLWS